MRRLLLIGLGLAVALAACDGGVPADSPTSTAADPGERVLKSAAEESCARMTDYAPGRASAKSAEALALIKREYEKCVAAVSREQPETTSADPIARRQNLLPALRGHSKP